MVNLEQMRAGWDRYASAYDEAITPFSMRVAEDALRIAGVTAGMKLLDIAAGGGALSIPAARLGAEVLAADFSPVMVELLNRKALEHGLSNLEARVMDGNALELNDGAFDVSCSQWGIMLFPDRRKALREMARVTRPSGKGVMVVFGPPQRVQIFSLFFQALSTAIPTFTPPQNSPLFSLQNPQDLEREMEEAGFSDVQVETQEHPFEVQSGDHLWSIMQFSAPATAGVVQQFTSEQQGAARTTLVDLLRAQYGDGPVQLPTVTHVGIGVK